MSKLLAYTIGGQKIGIDIQIWDDGMLSGNTAFIAIADTGSTPTNYTDISSLENWDNFGGGTTLTYDQIKVEIGKLIPENPTPEQIQILLDWNLILLLSTLSGESGTFWGDFRVEGKLWIETIRRVKQEANIIYVRVDQDDGLGGGAIAGLSILNPTGATTGYTSLDDIPYYIIGVDKDGDLVAGWSGNTQPIAFGSSSPTDGQIQLVDSVGGQDINPVTPTALTWGQEDFKDSSTYTHAANGSTVTVLKTGLYELSFNLNGEMTSNSRSVPGAQFRVNSTPIPATLSSDYARNSSNNDVNLSTPPYMINLTANDVIDLTVFRLGDNTATESKAGTTFMRITYLG